MRIPESDEDLLQFCTISTFKSGGKGGQHVNKTESAVRIIHNETGIAATSQRERSQYLNKKECMRVLRLRLAKLNEKKKPRIKTRVTAAAKRKRTDLKLKKGVIKALRKAPSHEAE